MAGMGLTVRLLLVAVILCVVADQCMASYRSYRSYSYYGSYGSYGYYGSYSSYRYSSGYNTSSSSDQGMVAGIVVGCIVGTVGIVALIILGKKYCASSTRATSKVSAVRSPPAKAAASPAAAYTTTTATPTPTPQPQPVAQQQLPPYTVFPAGQVVPPPPAYDQAAMGGYSCPPPTAHPDPFEAAVSSHTAAK